MIHTYTRQNILAMRSCSYHAKFSKFKHLAGKSRMSTVTTCLDNVYFIPSFSTTAWVK